MSDHKKTDFDPNKFKVVGGGKTEKPDSDRHDAPLHEDEIHAFELPPEVGEILVSVLKDLAANREAESEAERGEQEQKQKEARRIFDQMSEELTDQFSILKAGPVMESLIILAKEAVKDRNKVNEMDKMTDKNFLFMDGRIDSLEKRIGELEERTRSADRVIEQDFNIIQNKMGSLEKENIHLKEVTNKLRAEINHIQIYIPPSPPPMPINPTPPTPGAIPPGMPPAPPVPQPAPAYIPPKAPKVDP